MTSAISIFRKVRLSSEKLDRLDVAVEQLRQITKQPFSLSKSMFGRYIVAENDFVLAAVVGTSTRPSRITVVAVDTLGNHLLPSESAFAADHCCELLGVKTEPEKAALLKLFSSSCAGMR